MLDLLLLTAKLTHLSSLPMAPPRAKSSPTLVLEYLLRMRLFIENMLGSEHNGFYVECDNEEIMDESTRKSTLFKTSISESGSFKKVDTRIRTDLASLVFKNADGMGLCIEHMLQLRERGACNEPKWDDWSRCFLRPYNR
jgi:hypothetical protein